MTPNVPPPPDESTTPVTRYYTFGIGSTCRFTGEPLADHHATITAPTAAICRELMFATFGREWAFEYDSLDAATRGGRYPSTEHARIVVPSAALDAFGGTNGAVAEAKPDTLGVPLGRAQAAREDGAS